MPGNIMEKINWELLKNTGKTMQSSVKANMGSSRESHFLLTQYPLMTKLLPSRQREGRGCGYPSGKIIQHTPGYVHNTIGERLAEGLGSKTCSKWGNMWLVASH